MISGAELSSCRQYRYALWRLWQMDLPAMVWIMLNPSKADETMDDPTIRRCAGYSRSWGFGGFVVVNLFAWRATDSSELPRVADPIGPDNDYFIDAFTDAGALVVCAWGTRVPKALRSRERAVYDLLVGKKAKPHMLRLSKDGIPSHPLYLPASLTAQPWKMAA